MSNRRAYTPDTLATINRFFVALDTLIEHRLVRNEYAFCIEHNIDRRHLYAQRKDVGRGYFEVGWLVPLIAKYGISSLWLLTGRGLMFAQ